MLANKQTTTLTTWCSCHYDLCIWRNNTCCFI